MNWKQVHKKYDYLLALAVIALGVFGVVMIYTSVFSEAVPLHVRNANLGLWQRQRAFIITGVILMLVFSFIDYHYITRFYWAIYAAMLLLLVVVLLIGKDEGTGVARWIWIPLPLIGALSMQPSEFAKIFITIFLAKFLEVYRFNRPFLFAAVLALIGVPVILVVLQPSFSASMVVLTVSLTVLFVGGLYWRIILAGLAVVAPIIVVIWFDLQREVPIIVTRFLGEWQWRRIESFLRPELANPDTVRQTQGSVEAIIKGGLTGNGFLGNPYIILGNNDFIFSVAASQFGFVGAAVLLGVVAFIISRCILIALRAVDMEGRLLAAGVAGMLIFETFFHVSVATNLLPNTGMPFPFMSYGGSMIWVHMLAIGMVLNVRLPRKPRSIFDEQDEEE